MQTVDITNPLESRAGGDTYRLTVGPWSTPIPSLQPYIFVRACFQLNSQTIHPMKCLTITVLSHNAVYPVGRITLSINLVSLRLLVIITCPRVSLGNPPTSHLPSSFPRTARLLLYVLATWNPSEVAGWPNRLLRWRIGGWLASIPTHTTACLCTTILRSTPIVMQLLI